jgi:RNA polymerase sigma factor (sigma-70 family)
VTDEELMTAVQRGDTRRLGVLFDRHHTALFRYFLRLGGSRSLSEDLTQEVFFRMLRAGETWRADSRFVNWMYRIARNVFIDYQRKQRWETEMAPEFDVPAPQGNGYEQEQEWELVRQALAQLPPDKRELLVLSRYQGMKYEQIGELLGVETGTIKVRVFRALQQLRGIYEGLTGGQHALSRTGN